MDLGLNSKIAVVTGSSEGIGKATATALSQEGAKVAICARRPDQLESAAQEIRSASGGEVLAVPTDVMQPAQLEAFLQRRHRHVGRHRYLSEQRGHRRVRRL